MTLSVTIDERSAKSNLQRRSIHRSPGRQRSLSCLLRIINLTTAPSRVLKEGSDEKHGEELPAVQVHRSCDGQMTLASMTPHIGIYFRGIDIRRQYHERNLSRS
jgi:hypothetical protein